MVSSFGEFVLLELNILKITLRFEQFDSKLIMDNGPKATHGVSGLPLHFISIQRIISLCSVWS